METEGEVGSTEFYGKVQRKNILQGLPFCEQTKCGCLNFQNYLSLKLQDLIVRNHILMHFREVSV
jgi:hypothetical protein